MRGLRAFLSAGHAEAAGWPRDELYRVPPQWSRVDLCGIGLLIGDREVTEVTSGEIRIKMKGMESLLESAGSSTPR